MAEANIEVNKTVTKVSSKMDFILKVCKLATMFIAVVVFVWQASAYNSNFKKTVSDKVDKDTLQAFKNELKEKFDDDDENLRMIAKQIVKISKALNVEVDDDLSALSMKKKKYLSK